ncbi:MAG TPA: hypothetical protein VFE62_19845, partial [Gemmataceae bacterium]|nr:hypothetical protein [Gemmataceae bacterium]
MRHCVLVLAAVVGMFSLAAAAQTQPDKKSAAKGMDDLKAKTKDDSKSKAKDDIKAKTKDDFKPKTKDDKSKDDGKTKQASKGLDPTKLPKDAIIVVVDNMLDALGIFPKMAVLNYDKYVEMLETINSLKRQLKNEKKTPSSCKLFGRLEDDFLVFRAEFLFSTEQPKTVVSLGLKGGHLLGLGELDGRPPLLDVGDDGFSVRVDKEGDHQLVLNFRTPAKVSTTSGIERQATLGLADSAVTIVTLDLPNSIRELRCNDTLEKTRTPGHWVIGLERTKLPLTLAWKEPAPLSGNPAPKADGQIAVRIDKDVNLFAKFFLQDARLQTKEWRLLVPAQAKVELVAPPAGVAYELIPPMGNIPYYTLKTPEATGERWQVVVSATLPRPNPGVRLPIGPLHVLGAQQSGTITVTMPANYSFGQRLIFTRTDALRQLKNFETEAVFEYVVDKNPKGNNVKAPLEIEWRFEKNQAKTEVRHAFKLRAVGQAWEIEAMTRIHLTGLFSAVNSVDIKLPQPYPQGMTMVGSMMPGAGFPVGLPWVGMWKVYGMTWLDISPDDFTIADEAGNPLSTSRLDGTGRTRVTMERTAKEVTLVLRNVYRVPLQSHHLRLELPRPLNTQDRGAKVSIQADERVELLHGSAGALEPVPDRDHFEQSFDQAPSVIDIAWRPFRREIVAQGTVDVDIHEHSAQVQQSLHFARERPAAGPEVKNPLIELLVPAGVDKLAVSDGQITFDRVRHKAWLRTNGDAGDVDVVLTYDLAIKDRSLKITPVWPASASQKDVKVRLWTPAGVQARLNAETIQRVIWKERSIEAVPDRKHFP